MAPINPATSGRRPTRAVSSPWVQIVREKSEPIAAEPAMASGSSSPPSSTSCSSSPSIVQDTGFEGAQSNSVPNGNVGKRFPWAEGVPVMAAVSMPALSEPNRTSTKSSSESLNGVSVSQASMKRNSLKACCNGGLSQPESEQGSEIVERTGATERSGFGSHQGRVGQA